jgi:hypothetical protein
VCWLLLLAARVLFTKPQHQQHLNGGWVRAGGCVAQLVGPGEPRAHGQAVGPRGAGARGGPPPVNSKEPFETPVEFQGACIEIPFECQVAC